MHAPFDAEEDGEAKPVRAWMKWLTFCVLSFIVIVLQCESYIIERSLTGDDRDFQIALNATLDESDADYLDLAEPFYHSGRSVSSFIEFDAVDVLLDNLVSTHQEHWTRRLNAVLNKKLVANLNRAMGDMFTIEELHLHFTDRGDASLAGMLEATSVNVTRGCEPQPKKLPRGTSCVRLAVAFAYHGLVELKVRGLRHLGSGRLPVAVRMLEGLMLGVSKRRAAKRERQEAMSAQLAAAAADGEERLLAGVDPDGAYFRGNDSGEDAEAAEGEEGWGHGGVDYEYGMTLDIGARLGDVLVLHLDVHSSIHEAWPSPKRVRIVHIPPLQLQRRQLKIQDEWGVFKGLLAIVPRSVLLRRLERGLNTLLKRHFNERHKGWRIRLGKRKADGELSDPPQQSIAAAVTTMADSVASAAQTFFKASSADEVLSWLD